MGSTPIYGFPYPGVGDSPNGPNQVQQLAEAVESALDTVDDRVDALESKVENTLEVVKTGNHTITTENDLTGLTTSVTTNQASVRLTITACLDWECSGTGDITQVKCYVNGVSQPEEMTRGGVSGRFPISKTWQVTIAAASTFTVKLTAVKLAGADTSTIHGTHSTLKVSGNGIA